MEWPSRNVSRGGVLHSAKASYCPETHQFLKLLMDESKLSMTQRKKFNYFLRNGEPLPSLAAPTSRKSRIPEITIRPGTSKRRSRDTIIQSGVYERDKFHPMHPRIDRDREKEKLQNIMAFNKDLKVTKDNVLKRLADKVEGDISEMNRFDQLEHEIKEREEWLKEMEELGQGDLYRSIIQQQIQAKIREMNNLKAPCIRNK